MMLVQNRKRMGLIVVVVVVGLALSGIIPALACGGGDPMYGFADPAAPKPIIMAAFNNLSSKLGTQLDPNVTPWTWNETVFANTSLECPANGQAVDKTLTHGYDITISVWANGKYTDYFFNSTKDGKTLFQCTKAGPGPNIPLSA